MKTHNHLFEQICSFGNLLAAAKRAASGRRTQDSVGRFATNLEREVLRLREELLARSYRPGGYREKIITRPKVRMISAAPFRDRVVHHAVCAVAMPCFERKMIHDLYSNRAGKGTHAAIRRAQEFSRRFDCVLKCDVRKFFPSIDHTCSRERCAAPTACNAAARGTTPRPTCGAPTATTTRRPTPTTTSDSDVRGGFGDARAPQAERALSRKRAATIPKAHLPRPVSAALRRGNEHGSGAGAGSDSRTSRRHVAAGFGVRGLVRALRGPQLAAEGGRSEAVPRRQAGASAKRRRVAALQGAARFILAALILVLGTLEVRATFSTSDIFGFDTRDTLSTHYAASGAFSLDTRDSNATHYAVSGAFAFNTTARDGLSGVRTSSGFSFDTRTAVASGLAIVGPAVLTRGAQAEYHVVMNAPGGGTTDVTSNAFLAFQGGAPTWAGIGGTTLFILRNAPAGATTQLIARYQNAGGQVLSAPFTVTVGAAFFAGMTASASPPSGTNYTITLTGTASGGTGPYTYRWDTDNDGAYDDELGSPRTFTKTSASGGTFPMKLEVTDATNAKAYARASVTLNRTTVKPVADVGAGTLYGADGHPFAFDTNRTANGFILLTHGLHSSGFEPWLRTDLPQRLTTRLSGQIPNIAVFDWGEDSDPGGEVSPFKLAMLDVLGKVSAGAGLISAVRNGLSAFARTALEESLNELIDSALHLPGPEDYAVWADFAIDCYYVRQIAQSHGVTLASWIWLQANAGLIDPSKPIHLVGHSAGGFCVAECALWLKQHPLPSGQIVVVDRVTMLDTPFPIPSHLTQLPNPTVVEQVVSSVYGALEVSATRKVSPSATYHFETLAGWDQRWSTDDTGHGLAHRWYRRTVLPAGEADGGVLDAFAPLGFNASPFITGELVERPAPSAPAMGMALAFAPVANAMSGFTTFGDVTESGGVFTITEAADAGITKTVTVPIGAYAVKFRFKFAAAGDGDYLAVHFGDDTLLYTGVDTTLSRAAFTEIEAPLDGRDGSTGALTFTLVSRGSANAVVEVADIDFLVADDPDGDSIATAQEQLAGTDPLAADTDGDGLSDSDEAAAGTNPLLADSDGDGLSDSAEVFAGSNPMDSTSRFAVVAMERNGSGSPVITWNSQAGRTYAVRRSADPGFASFEVVVAGLPAAGSLTNFTDTTVPAGASAMFYRVAVEQ